MVVMFIPAVFFVGGLAYVIPKAFVPGHTMESLSFIIMLGIHILVYTGVYYGISVLAAKLITLINNLVVRFCILLILLLGLVSITQLSIYGGVGHGPVHLLTLAELFADLNKSYGSGTVAIVYGTFIILFSLIVLLRKYKKKTLS
jgi:hypothetical protein